MCLWSVVVWFQPGHSCPSSRSLFGTWANLTSAQHLHPDPRSSTLRKGPTLAPSPHPPFSDLQHPPSYFHPLGVCACLYSTVNHTDRELSAHTYTVISHRHAIWQMAQLFLLAKAKCPKLLFFSICCGLLTDCWYRAIYKSVCARKQKYVRCERKHTCAALLLREEMPEYVGGFRSSVPMLSKVSLKPLLTELLSSQLWIDKWNIW